MAGSDRNDVTGRPPALFPLFSELETLPGIGPKTAKALAALNINAPRDLLFTLPVSGIDRRRMPSVQNADLPATVTVAVEVGAHRPPRKKGGPYRIDVRDQALAFQLVFFRASETYLSHLLPTGARRIVSGKAELFEGIVQMPHPDFLLPVESADEIPVFEPVYPLTAGVSQKTMFKATRGALRAVPHLTEWIDPAQRAKAAWPDFSEALASAHTPQALADVAVSAGARRRLAYDELFAHQLTLALARRRYRQSPGHVTRSSGTLRKMVQAQLPYRLTASQVGAVAEIEADMARPLRMMRLLQGDVGAGKTVVAFLALLIAVEAGGQGALMAPTEILARQHLESLRPLAEQAGVSLDVLTGRDKGAGRAAKLDALASGALQIVVGTHALFQNDVVFQDLRLAVVDEQHRFGVRQRLELGKKGTAVDVLVMTATPIPRSLALAQYGDMDVSILSEKPPGRKPIKTATLPVDRLAEVVARPKIAATEGRQAYWVCPLVEESEVVDLVAAEARFAHLRAELGEGRVGLVHGQMPPAEKDAAMARFQAGETAVLVATTVIEVGVDVPNASIMVIERAESFGLAQLHQLRGRVGRGAAQSTCLLLYQAPLTQSGLRRLQVLRDTEDGFEIAQADLALRGIGDVIGTAQSGLPRFQIADLERQTDLMATANSDARALLEVDPDLTSERGRAARVLLYLMRQDEAIKLMSIG